MLDIDSDDLNEQDIFSDNLVIDDEESSDDNQETSVDDNNGSNDRASKQENVDPREVAESKQHISPNPSRMNVDDKSAHSSMTRGNGKTKGSGTTTPRMHPSECFSTSEGWASLRLSRPLLKACADLGFKQPTDIQEQGIPLALQGRDILGTARTGSGKTAAFLLPVLERLCQSEAVKKRRMTSHGVVGGAYVTKALILLPTRELAAQCFEMLEALSRYTPVTKILVTGGLSQKAQTTSFRRQPDIVVATPGRILDILMNTSGIYIELLEIVVLDEADRLLDLGFKQECLEILSHASKKRQTLLFSATLSEAINDLALLSLKNPIRVDVSRNHSLPGTLSQRTIPVPSDKNIQHATLRKAILLHLCLQKYNTERIVVFFRTKKDAHHCALLFRLLGIRHAELHGNLTQAKRLEALETFHSQKHVRILLCSELAARGLDIPHIDIVINLMVPPDASRYIHQVGRTARLGRQGTAITLYSPEEKLTLKRIIRHTSKSGGTPALKMCIPPENYSTWKDRIISLQSAIEDILKNEFLEKEIRLAEMEAQKGINMQLYESEILARPKKRWLGKSGFEKCSHEDKRAKQAHNLYDAIERHEESKLGKDNNVCQSDQDFVVSQDSSAVDDDTDSSDSLSTTNSTLKLRVKKDVIRKLPSTAFTKASQPKVSKPTLGSKATRSSVTGVEKNRLLKERTAKYAHNRRTPKQKASLRAQVTSKAIGSKVKRSKRLARKTGNSDA